MDCGVDVVGSCVTRNGEVEVGRMTCALKGEQAHMGFVSSQLRRSLHSGAVVRVSDMDAFCTEWLRMRGHALDARPHGVHLVKMALNELCNAIDAL
jgi:hypothetical protein